MRAEKWSAANGEGVVMETRSGRATGSHELVPDSLAVVDEFRELSRAAAQLLPRAEALRHEWAAMLAESLLCDWSQEPADLALLDELSEWVERAHHLTATPARHMHDGHRATAALVEDHGPGYFVG
jgi:hypothetical protein